MKTILAENLNNSASTQFYYQFLWGDYGEEKLIQILDLVFEPFGNIKDVIKLFLNNKAISGQNMKFLLCIVLEILQ